MDDYQLENKSRREEDLQIFTPIKTINKKPLRQRGTELLKPLKKHMHRSVSNQIAEDLLNTTHRFTGRSISIPTNARIRILNKLKQADKSQEEQMINDLVAEDFQVAKPDVQIRQSILKKIERSNKISVQANIEKDSDDESQFFENFHKKKNHKPKLRFDMRLHELKSARMIELNIEQNDESVQ